MREIKFRGKRTDNGEWVYSSLIDEDYISLSEWSSVILESVSQYTGLKDKNGKEIYAHDIVKCTEVDNNGLAEYISEIEYYYCDFVVSKTQERDTPLCIFFGDDAECQITEIEVIGNVYDNPELLERRQIDVSICK